MMPNQTRRHFLGNLGLGAGAAAALSLGVGARRAEAQTLPPEGAGTDPRFLFVFACSGGASIIDSVLAVRESESANAAVLNTFPDALVRGFEGSPFRAVDQDRDALGQIPAGVAARQAWFVEKHRRQMAAVTWERTSVNHQVGQRRSVTGNEAWAGRTLQECVALQHGVGRPLPNVHLANGSGYTEMGNDLSLPSFCFGETVTAPGTWPLSLDGRRGILNAPGGALLARARKLRNERLDPGTPFSQAFAQSPRLRHWQHIRGAPQAAIENLDLISKLMVYRDSPSTPLGAFGLQSSPDLDRVRAAFPNVESDPLEAQAALAFLLVKYGVSVSVTLGPSGDFLLEPEYAGFDVGAGRGREGDGPLLPPGAVLNPPIAFDFSHNGHRSVQALMWDRMYRIADGLIGLLASEEFGGGQSYWDRSLIYFASDFGRTKNRPENATEFASGHNLNNGVLTISPLVKGDTVLGGVDPDTCLTYGCDPLTGRPEPGRNNAEAEVFAGLLDTLGVDTARSGLPNFTALKRT